MSWNAQRYQRKLNEGPKSSHHIPPKHPGRPVIKRINAQMHRSYHHVFQNAESLQECIAILKRFWWPEAESGD